MKLVKLLLVLCFFKRILSKLVCIVDLKVLRSRVKSLQCAVEDYVVGHINPRSIEPLWDGHLVVFVTLTSENQSVRLDLTIFQAHLDELNSVHATTNATEILADDVIKLLRFNYLDGFDLRRVIEDFPAAALSDNAQHIVACAEVLVQPTHVQRPVDHRDFWRPDVRY